MRVGALAEIVQRVLAPVLRPALACSENKGPEALAEERKADSSGFQSLITGTRVSNTWYQHNGCM